MQENFLRNTPQLPLSLLLREAVPCMSNTGTQRYPRGQSFHL